MGGFDLGLVRAGMEIVFQVEIDEFCRKVLAKHAPEYWPNAERFNDVKEVGKHNLKPVDLLCGGFPCQPFSDIGKRQGEADERALWKEYARIIGELKPKWVLGENVSGLLTIDNGGYFRGILRDLSELGYNAEWGIIPASYLGASHRRERVYIVAYSHSLERKRRGTSLHIFETGAQNGGTWPNIGNSLRNGSESWGHSTFYQLQSFNSQLQRIRESSPWQNEPGICRVVNGSSNGVDRAKRLKGIGNAVVPQIVEILGRCIMEIENDT